MILKKIFTLVFGVFTIAMVLVRAEPEWEKMSEECKNELGLVDVPFNRFSEDPRLKCFIACLSKKSGIMNEDGKLDSKEVKWSFKKIYDLSYVNDTSELELMKCVTRANKKDNECEVAAFASTCITEIIDRKYKESVDNCTIEVGLTTAENFHSEKEVTPDEGEYKLKCFSACMDKRRKMIIDGKIDKKWALNNFSHHPGIGEDFNSEIIKCIDFANEETDECEMSDVAHKCIRNQMKKFFHGRKSHLRSSLRGPNRFNFRKTNFML